MKTAKVDCVYEIAVSRDGYQTELFDDVILSEGITSAFHVNLRPQETKR